MTINTKITLKVDGITFNPNEESEHIAVAIEKWYDRSRREWVLYPVDQSGYQISEAIYAFSKAEAKEVEKDLKEEYGIK